MAVQLTELNAFTTASTWADDTMLGMNGEGAVQKGNTYGGFLSAKKRTLDEKNANNAVRTGLLKALSQAFGIMTDRVYSGERFSQDFMRKLEKLLGSAFCHEMSKRIGIAAMSVLLSLVASAGVWPDGSAMDLWFADKSPVDESKLGRLRRAEEFGAKPGIVEMQTAALQRAIDAIAGDGGGVLVLGPGVWNSSSLFFKPGVHLKLEKGAVLKGPADGAGAPRRMTRMMGLTFEYVVALVNADRCDGFALYGEGMIDGNGRKTWEAFWTERRKSGKFHDATLPRPRNLYVSNSKDVRVSGVAIKDSHFWTTHFYKCERLRIDNVRITAPGAKTPPASPSADAIDLDAVRDVHVWNSFFNVNDDAFALKGGKYYKCEESPENGGNFNILVEDCVFGPVCHNAFTCGSEAFLCRNIIVRNCELQGCGSLLSLKSRPDTKQLYEHILMENVSGKCKNVIHMRPWTQWYELPEGVGKQETRAVNVVFRNCSVNGRENIKLDPSFMKLEGYVPPSGSSSAAPSAGKRRIEKSRRYSR